MKPLGFLDFFRRETKTAAAAKPPVDSPAKPNAVAVGAEPDEFRENADSYQGFNNSNITFSGSLKGYDYDSI